MIKKTIQTLIWAPVSLVLLQPEISWVWAKDAPTKKSFILDRLEASVNSTPILLSDVQNFRKAEKLREQLDPLFAGTPLANQGSSAPTAEIVNFLVDEKLISQQYPTGDTEVEQEINSIQKNNKIDREGLKQALLDQGYGFSEYFDLIRSSASKRSLIDRDIRSKVVISDDDIRNYFYNHYAKDSTTPRAFHIQIISVSSKNYKSPKAAYEVAIKGLNDARKGESFEEVAKQISDDPTASSGGDLGTLSEDQILPTIRDRVKNLQPGQFSEIFETGNPVSYTFLKLVDIKTTDSSQLEKMKDGIRNQLVTQEFQHQISLWLERQRQSAFIHRAGEDFAKELKLAP
jgi:peptidyl-prolyl cis-trans isomerase SurA